jgi:hypothetical protein
LPTTGTTHIDNQEANTFDNANTYRVAALAALQKGLTPYNKAAARKLSRTKSNTMFGKDFFTNILNFLNGEKALAKNADVDDLAETLAGDEDLAQTLQNSAIESAVNTAVAKVKPTALTMESLVALVEKAGDEDKAKIAAALNIKPAEAKKPAAKKTEGEDGEDDEDEGEDDNYTALKNQLQGALNEIAKLKKGGSPTTDTNGKSSVKPKTGDKEDGKIPQAQLDIALNALKKNQITREQFKNITGQEAPARL